MNRNSRWLGYTLIAIGLFFLVIKLAGYQFSIFSFWPFFLLIPGVLFHVFAYTHRITGLLIPGGILVTYSLLSFFSELTNYQFMVYLWPIFIIGPGVGLLEFYIFGERKFGVFVAALFLFAIGGTFLFISLLSTAIPYLIGFVFILIGIYLLFGKGKKEKRF